MAFMIAPTDGADIPAEQRRSAVSRGLMDFGFSLLANSGRPFGQALGQAGSAGMAGYDAAVDDIMSGQRARREQEAFEAEQAERERLSQLQQAQAAAREAYGQILAQSNPELAALYGANPAAVERMMAGAAAPLSAADDAQLALQRDRLDLTRENAEADRALKERQLATSLAFDERELALKEAASATKSQGELTDMAIKLRDKFHQQGGKPIQNIAEGLRGLRGAAGEDSAAGDLSLLFGYGKVLDPGSVVREGEISTLGNLGGLGEKLMRMAQNVKEGRLLTPKMRQEIMAAAETTAREKIGTYQPVIDQYTRVATDLDIDPADVIPDYQSVLALEPGPPETEALEPDLPVFDIEEQASELGVAPDVIAEAAREAGVTPERIIEALRAKQGGG